MWVLTVWLLFLPGLNLHLEYSLHGGRLEFHAGGGRGVKRP